MDKKRFELKLEESIQTARAFLKSNNYQSFVNEFEQMNKSCKSLYEKQKVNEAFAKVWNNFFFLKRDIHFLFRRKIFPYNRTK